MAAHIADKRMLLLLDNFEQVTDAAPGLSGLLSECRSLTLLVTSRETLRIDGESEYPLPPLADEEGVALFCARTGARTSEPIRELCRRLDGLPLAIELAAARAKVFTVEQLLERIGQRLDLLKGGRDADPRQQTLRATIRWSPDLLDDAERRLFAHLSVFAGGCTFDAAEEVAGADPDTLQSLVEKSLVRRTADRFWMLETIREFAVERLEELSPDEIRRGHAEYFTAIAERSDEALGNEAEGLLRRLDDEWGNLRSALEWSCGGGDPAIGLRLSGALWRFWWDRGAAREGSLWYEAALATGAGQPEELRALATYGAANMAMARDDSVEATALLEECLAVFRLAGDDLRVMRTLNDLGIASQLAGDLARARPFHEESLELALARGDVRAAASARVNLANAALTEERLQDAEELLRDIASSMRPLGHHDVLGTALETLAVVHLRRGELGAASAILRESIPMSQMASDRRGIAHALAVAAALRVELGDSIGAIRALAACASLCEETGLVLQATERDLYEQTRDEVRGTLGENEFDRALAGFASSPFDGILEEVVAGLE